MSEMEVNREKIQFLLIESTDLYLFFNVIQGANYRCVFMPIKLSLSSESLMQMQKNEKNIDKFHIMDIYEIQAHFLSAQRKFHRSRPCFTTDEIAYEVCCNFVFFFAAFD